MSLAEVAVTEAVEVDTEGTVAEVDMEAVATGVVDMEEEVVTALAVVVGMEEAAGIAAATAVVVVEVVATAVAAVAMEIISFLNNRTNE